MKNLLLSVLSVLVLTTTSFAADIPQKLKITEDWMNPSKDKCASETGLKTLYIIKQWHAPSHVDTRRNKKIVIPQANNQTQIYKQLAEWTDKKVISKIAVEGFDGQIKENSSMKYNGWTINDLKELKNRPDFAQITTHVGLKLEAKFGAAISVFGIDDDSLIKKHSLAFSDARGVMGFYTRIEQYKTNPNRLKPYMDGAIETFKLPANSTITQVQDSLKSQMQTSLQNINSSLKNRDQNFLNQLEMWEDKDIVFVVGGAHVDDLIEKINSRKWGCQIFTPDSYSSENENLMEKLLALVPPPAPKTVVEAALVPAVTLKAEPTPKK